MAVVNKKLNESLKSGSKVILRKEIVVERNVDVPTYDHITGLPTYKQRMCRDVVESSESYVNFEDVRLKVEQTMLDEVNRSINDRNQEKQAYAEMKNKLVNEQVGMKSNLQKEYEKKAKDLEEESKARSVILNQKNFAFLIYSLKSTNCQQSCMMI